MEERDNDIQPDAGITTKDREPKLSLPEPIQTTIDFSDSEELGRFLADVQLGKMIDAHDTRYTQGIQDFWQENSNIADDLRAMEGIAEIQLEERRKTLVEVAIKSTAYSVVGVFMALLTRMEPSKAAWVIIPSVLGAVYSTKEELVRKQ